MATLIAKKIKADISNGNIERMSRLVDYCATPENVNKVEKCILLRIGCFSGDENELTLEDIKSEFAFDFSEAKFQGNNEKLSHWILSTKKTSKNETIDTERLYYAAKDYVRKLGFGNSHKYLIAIHDDTDHPHAHILVCKVDMLTGKTYREGGGLYKTQGQKALALVAHEHGFELEKGAWYVVPPEAKQEIIKIGNEKVTQPKALKIRRNIDSLRPAHLSRSAFEYERRTGFKSEHRLLQEELISFFKENNEELKNWKVGDFHKHLAEHGISCERVKRGEKYGLVFSRDGQMWFAGGQIASGLTYKNLMKSLHVKDEGSWRDSRQHVKDLCQQVRDMRPSERVLMPETEKRTRFTAQAVGALLRVSPARVARSLNIPAMPKGRHGGAITDGCDICHLVGMSTMQALEYLAQTFPDALLGVGKIFKATSLVIRTLEDIVQALGKVDANRGQEPSAVQAEHQKTSAHVRVVSVPDRFSELGNDVIARLRQNGTDAKRLPGYAARALAVSGATMDEIYSFLIKNEPEDISADEWRHRAREAAYRAVAVGLLGRGRRRRPAPPVPIIPAQGDNLPPVRPLPSIRPVADTRQEALPVPPLRTEDVETVRQEAPQVEAPKPRPRVIVKRPSVFAPSARPPQPQAPRPEKATDTRRPTESPAPEQSRQPRPMPENDSPSFGMSM